MKLLTEKIVAVMNSVGSLQTDKTNKHQKYDYISADKILERVGKAMAKHGIVIYPQVTETERFSEGKAKHVGVTMSLEVTDGESRIVLAWVGYGVDHASWDKAYYKAVTSGHKYFIMKLFMIGVGNEDGEHENNDGEQDDEPKKKSPLDRFNLPQSDLDDLRALYLEVPGAIFDIEAQVDYALDNTRWRKGFHATGTAAYGKLWDDRRGLLTDHFGIESSNDLSLAQRVYALWRVGRERDLVVAMDGDISPFLEKHNIGMLADAPDELFFKK